MSLVYTKNLLLIFLISKSLCIFSSELRLEENWLAEIKIRVDSDHPVWLRTTVENIKDCCGIRTIFAKYRTPWRQHIKTLLADDQERMLDIMKRYNTVCFEVYQK